MDETTYEIPSTADKPAVVIGDEKQEAFFPRIKLKKWDNQANLSVGLIGGAESHTLDGTGITVLMTDGIQARFYSKSDDPAATTAIRYIQAGSVDPVTIAAQYELDRHFSWPLTIHTHRSDRPALMYYGDYPVEAYLDPKKIDLPACRLTSTAVNNPMYMDDGLWLVDIHYHEQRDDLPKLHQSMVEAVTTVLKGYGIEVITKGLKLYFADKDQDVKFFSTAFVGGHYYFYVNLDSDYNRAYDYYAVDQKKNDNQAYGLRAVNPDIPDSVVDEIIQAFATLYGLPLEDSLLSEAETTKLAELTEVHSDPEWINHSVRSDVYRSQAKQEDGFEFEIVLNDPPASNQVPLSVQSKELSFYYQPKEDTFADPTIVRSPEVIGSYAAYHTTKSDNQYGTGKAFHIYRPWATDALGRQVWCEFDPDWDGVGDLNITIPQDFLDTATYPITIDPTFGYTTLGATAIATTDIQGTVYTGVAGTVTKMTAGTLNTAVEKTKTAIYKSSDSTLVVASAERVAAGENLKAFRDYTISGTPLITGQDYVLVAWGDESSTYDQFYYDSLTGAGRNQVLGYAAQSGVYPSTATFTTNDRKYSVYVTYRRRGWLLLTGVGT